MNPLLKKILNSRYEYLTLDRSFIVLEISFGARYFADHPDALFPGNDVRLAFPELVGIEDILIDILEGRETSFEIKGLARANKQRLTSEEQVTSSLYIDLHIGEAYNQKYFQNSLLVLIEDATERMLLQQSLTQRLNETTLLLSSLPISKNYIDKIIASIADALIVTTSTGIIKTANQFAQDLFGYNSGELIDVSISKLILDQDFLRKVNNLSHLQVGEFLKDVEVTCQKKNGEHTVVAFSCSAIQTEIEGLKNFVYIGRDLSDRKRLEAEMVKALEREKELSILKSDFVSMASHEFRTPLTSILSSTELLEKYASRWPEEKKNKHYRRIENSVKRMTELLDDLLLVSKADAGKLELNLKPLYLKRFCRNLVEEIQLGIGRNHTITFVYLGKNSKVCLDEKILIQILNNLLTNAVKYSPQHTTVRFTCSCENNKVLFEIQDEGIGVPVEDQARLFESFQRATNVGNIPGTGLGLALVQKSVKLHGGDISFVSEVGVGTTFKVSLPLNINQNN